MAVRVLVWNIKFFSMSSIQKKGRGPKIVNQVHPAGGAPSYDLFIIVEPNKYPNPITVGEVPLAGSSVFALQTLLYGLRSRSAHWQLLPPRVVSIFSTHEIHGVFYLDTALQFVALDNPVVATAVAAVPTPLPPVLANLAVAVAPAAYGGLNITVPSGTVEHSPDANPATPANEVDFPFRRPFRNRFREIATNQTFDIFSIHTAPDASYPANFEGVRAFTMVNDIMEGQTARVILAGDMNCCTFNPCPNKPSGHHADEINSQDYLTTDGAAAYEHWVAMRDCIGAVIALTDAFDALPWAGIQAVPPTAPAVDQYTLAAQGLAALLNAVHAHAATVQAAFGTPDPTLAGLLTTAANAAVQLGALPMVGNAAVLPPLIATATAAAQAARDAGLALTDFLGNHFSPPVMLEKQAQAAKQTAAAQDARRLGAPGIAAVVTAVKLVGAAVQAGMDVFTAELGTALSNAAEQSATNASAATAATPNLLALATTARDNLRRVEPLLFQTHIKELSSLRTASTALPANYRNHAFDHILTLGFTSVNNAQVVDRVQNDPRYAAAAATPANFPAFYNRHFKGPGSGQKGISDHLPVQITVVQ